MVSCDFCRVAEISDKIYYAYDVQENCPIAPSSPPPRSPTPHPLQMITNQFKENMIQG